MRRLLSVHLGMKGVLGRAEAQQIFTGLGGIGDKGIFFPSDAAGDGELFSLEEASTELAPWPPSPIPGSMYR